VKTLAVVFKINKWVIFNNVWKQFKLCKDCWGNFWALLLCRV